MLQGEDFTARPRGLTRCRLVSEVLSSVKRNSVPPFQKISRLVEFYIAKYVPDVDDQPVIPDSSGLLPVFPLETFNPSNFDWLMTAPE
jgi:hypothetical protein